MAFLRLLLPLLVVSPAFAQTDNLKDGPNVDLVRQECLACHEDSYITASNFDRATWDEMLDVMVGMGMAPLDDANRELVLDYLEAAQGPESDDDDGEADPATPWAEPLYRPNPLDWTGPRR